MEVYRRLVAAARLRTGRPAPHRLRQRPAVSPSISIRGLWPAPLEAIASGVPVLTSPLSCLPEVCRSTALYADAADDVAYANAIEKALTNDQWREAAIAQGLKRAGDFT